MCSYWGSDLGRKRRDKAKRGIPQKGWSKQCDTKVRYIDGGERKYLLGEDVWIGDDGGDEGWFLLLEEVVCDQYYEYLDAEKIILQGLGLIKAKEVLLNREKGVWVLAGGLHPEVQNMFPREPRQVDTA